VIGTRRGLIVSCLFVAVACTAHDANPTPSSSPSSPSGVASGTAKPDGRPVVDVAPYWCDLVPREALARMGGFRNGLAEFRTPTDTASQTVCGVKDAEQYGPLGVTWDLKHGRELIAASLRQVSADHPQRLPARLGSGFVSYSPRTSRLPHEAGSLFRCGSREPWIYLALRYVSPGRDATRDLIDLMRIAQKRFGEIYRCSPRPL
jgi:hypothetical protein